MTDSSIAMNTASADEQDHVEENGPLKQHIQTRFNQHDLDSHSTRQNFEHLRSVVLGVAQAVDSAGTWVEELRDSHDADKAKLEDVAKRIEDAVKKVDALVGRVDEIERRMVEAKGL